MANRDMVKWQSNVLSHLDDDDSDSDKESALSGSFMVDSVMWVGDIAMTVCDSVMTVGGSVVCITNIVVALKDWGLVFGMATTCVWVVW